MPHNHVYKQNHNNMHSYNCVFSLLDSFSYQIYTRSLTKEKIIVLLFSFIKARYKNVINLVLLYQLYIVFHTLIETKGIYCTINNKSIGQIWKLMLILNKISSLLLHYQPKTHSIKLGEKKMHLHINLKYSWKSMLYNKIYIII